MQNQHYKVLTKYTEPLTTRQEIGATFRALLASDTARDYAKAFAVASVALPLLWFLLVSALLILPH